MRYSMTFDKLINRLVPHYISGRRLMLFLQATMKPLQSLCDAWAIWAAEMRIDAAMTSQISYFEWYLNRRLGKYIEGRIYIRNAVRPGVPVYYQSENFPPYEMLELYHQGEEGRRTPFYLEGEESQDFTYSFYVITPEPDPNLITRAEYESMLRYYVDRYRIANKTYTIRYKNI